MIALFTEIFKIALTLIQWFFGDKAERTKRAKEIADQFKRISVEGDSLFEQVWSEQNRRSTTDWDDINPRN